MLGNHHEIPLRLMQAAFVDGRWDGALTLTVERGGHLVHVRAGADKQTQARRVRCDVPLREVLPVQCSLLGGRAQYVGSGMPALETGDARFDAAFNLRGVPAFLVRAGLRDGTRAVLLRYVDVWTALDIEDGQVSLSIDARRASPDAVNALVHMQTELVDTLVHASRAHLASMPPEHRGSAQARLANEVARAQATRRRSSVLVGMVTVGFVLALLGGIGLLFIRSLP